MASPSEISTRTGSRRARRLPPSIPRRSTYSLCLPRPTEAQSHVFAPLPLQRVDPGLQSSHRRNLSLQPSEILSHPVPPLALVHIPDLSVADTRLCPTVPPEAAGIDRDVPGLRGGVGQGDLPDGPPLATPRLVHTERGSSCRTRRALSSRNTCATRTTATRACVRLSSITVRSVGDRRARIMRPSASGICP